MGAKCSCETECTGHASTWDGYKSKMTAMAQQRRGMNKCKCVSRRPKWLMIKRGSGKKKKMVRFQNCTCPQHICCVKPDAIIAPNTPRGKHVCRFTVDAYFSE